MSTINPASTITKEPIVLQFEEQERKFSPKRRHKEEEEDVENDEIVADIDKQPKDKVARVETEVIDATNVLLPVKPAPTQAKSAYEIPCILGPSTDTSSSATSKATDVGAGASDRSSRNIAFLCARIAEELKRKGPQTRDELSATTGFARQRICTVISVFKAIGLVNIRDSNTRRSEIEWNEQQAKVLPNASTYVAKILQLRNENKELKSKEQELLRKLLEKRQVTSSSSSALPILSSTSTASSSSSSQSAPVANIAPMMSIMSPPNAATFTLDEEEKYGLQGTRHLMGVDSSAALSLLAPNKATEGF